MAILEGLPGIKVSIESQGRALQEYEDEEGWSNTKYTVPENNRKSAYVECTSDAEFQINFSIEPPYILKDNLTFSVTTDGQTVSCITARRLTRDHWSDQIVSTHERSGPNEVLRRKLKFASIQRGGLRVLAVDEQF